MSPMEITVATGEFARVADLLDRLGAERHLAPEAIADMQVALDEVLTNIAEYAYTDSARHTIHVRFRVLDDALEAIIDDDGLPFDPLTIPAPEKSTRLRERRVGGVGIHFVRNLMDEVAYNRVGEINRLVLTKRFKRFKR